MKKLRIMKKMLVWFFFVFMSLFIILPLISLVIWSFTKLWPWPQLFPETLSLESWSYLFSGSGRAFEGLCNSMIVAVITVILNILLGFPAAKVLSQKQFYGKGIIFIILLSPLFIPITVSIMGMHQIAIQMDFLNDYLSTAIAHTLVTLPYFIVMLWYQFKLMGLKLQEAAHSLGASQMKVFFWIELPLITPAILLSCLLVMVISLSQYLPTWIMSGGTLMTLPLLIFPFASSGNASIVAVYSIWFFVPVLILVTIYYVLLKLYNKRLSG